MSGASSQSEQESSEGEEEAVPNEALWVDFRDKAWHFLAGGGFSQPQAQEIEAALAAAYPPGEADARASQSYKTACTALRTAMRDASVRSALQCGHVTATGTSGLVATVQASLSADAERSSAEVAASVVETCVEATALWMCG